jgi:heptaprenyl diphosphate synthase
VIGMKENPARRVAFTGVMLSLAAALSFLESLLPVTAVLPPGVRLGLSNIVTMYALFFLGKKEAFTVAVGKSLFVFIIRAPIAALLSFCGGVLSILVMLAALRRKDASYILISTAGAVAHNIGQLCASVFVIGSAFTFWYLPVLILSGAAMGVLTSILLSVLLPALRRIRFVS